MTDLLPAGWDPGPLSTALDMFANDTPIDGRIVFDYGPAGTVTVALALDPAQLTRDVTDQLLAQLAQLSLLAANQTSP